MTAVHFCDRQSSGTRIVRLVSGNIPGDGPLSPVVMVGSAVSSCKSEEQSGDRPRGEEGLCRTSKDACETVRIELMSTRT